MCEAMPDGKINEARTNFIEAKLDDARRDKAIF